MAFDVVPVTTTTDITRIFSEQKIGYTLKKCEYCKNTTYFSK